MAHLNFFGLENFRVFKDLQRFDLKPITILVGTNSSGKSSLSKGILLLKDGFEKINIQAPEKYINMWSLEKLMFPNELNIGNFENCKNNKNIEKNELVFELPMRFPLIEDLFCMQFSYSKDDNAIKNGKLIFVKIIHLNSNKTIFSFDSNDGYFQLKFSFLKNKFDNEIPKYIKWAEIENKINTEINITTKEEIDALKNEQLKLLPNFGDVFFYDLNDDWNSFKSLINMYTTHLATPLNKYLPDLPLINYPINFNEDFIKNHKTELQINNNQILEIISKNKIIKNKIEAKGKNVLEYLKSIELMCLDELKIGSPSFNQYPDFISFSNCFSQLKNSVDIAKMLCKKLIEKDEIFRDIFSEHIDYLKDFKLGYLTLEELENPRKFNDFIFNPIKDILPENLNYFIQNFIYEGIVSSLKTFSTIYKSINYIPAVRTKIDRLYRNNQESYFHEVLYAFHQKTISKTANDFINKYIKIFGIADEIEISLAEDSSFTKIYLKKNGIRQDLADFGYGVAQVLPIILKIGNLISTGEPEPEYGQFERDSSIIIVEEPETNLHPALQSLLADMFVESYQKYKIQFIVETHSEYLIRKLQYLTAKGEFSPKDSNIYYFNDPNNIPSGEPQIKKIEILEDGSLSDDFGTGFFDEAANWKFELLQIRKAQKN